MFEYKIQQAFESYKKDFGLGRICLFIVLYNSFLVFLGIFAFNILFKILFVPIILAFCFFYFRPKIIRLNYNLIFSVNAILLTMTFLLNYLMVGEFDRAVGQLSRYDHVFHQTDIFMFGGMPSLLLETFFDRLGNWSWLIFDLLISCYYVYFLLPVYGGIIYFKQLKPHNKYLIGRYFFSIIIFFSLNYLFYLAVPVSGPQYYLKSAYLNDPSFSVFGQFLFDQVRNNHTTFIDCFPSGHFGISFMLVIWFLRMKTRHAYVAIFFCFAIGFATITLRYHYVLDLVFAIPFTFICYKLGHFLFPVEVDKRR